MTDKGGNIPVEEVKEFAREYRTSKRQEYRRGEHGYDAFSQPYRGGMSEGMAVMAEKLLMWLECREDE